jgi:hypothetical protein
MRLSDGMTVTVERGVDGKINGLRTPDGQILSRDK